MVLQGNHRIEFLDGIAECSYFRRRSSASGLDGRVNLDDMLELQNKMHWLMKHAKLLGYEVGVLFCWSWGVG
jgi:hypothetical protein